MLRIGEFLRTKFNLLLRYFPLTAFLLSARPLACLPACPLARLPAYPLARLPAYQYYPRDPGQLPT
jgi:hypothetical protein